MPLEQVIEFPRSRANELGNIDYSPGWLSRIWTSSGLAFRLDGASV